MPDSSGRIRPVSVPAVPWHDKQSLSHPALKAEAVRQRLTPDRLNAETREQDQPKETRGRS